MNTGMRGSLAFVMQPGDDRPPSLLDRRAWSAKMATGGVLAMLGAHLLVPGTLALLLALLAATGAGEKPVRTFDPEHVVEARFVKLGQKLDPRKIPNRKVPIKTTAPKPGVAVSKELDPKQPKEVDAGRPPPEQAEDDLVTRFGDRAQAFSEIADREIQEGDPNGIAEGTEATGRAGDLYLGQVAVFVKRGWTVPTTLADPSALVTKVTVEITADRHVGAHSVVKSSGDALFDQSVEDRINALRAQNATLPEPPPEVADRYAAAWTLSINWNGRDAH